MSNIAKDKTLTDTVYENVKEFFLRDQKLHVDELKEDLKHAKEVADDTYRDVKHATKKGAKEIKDIAKDSAHRMVDGSSSTMKDIKKGAVQMKENVKDTMQEAAKDVKAVAGDVKDAIVDKTHKVTRDTKHAVEDATHKVSREIRESKPIQKMIPKIHRSPVIGNIDPVEHKGLLHQIEQFDKDTSLDKVADFLKSHESDIKQGLSFLGVKNTNTELVSNALENVNSLADYFKEHKVDKNEFISGLKQVAQDVKQTGTDLSGLVGTALKGLGVNSTVSDIITANMKNVDVQNIMKQASAIGSYTIDTIKEHPQIALAIALPIAKTMLSKYTEDAKNVKEAITESGVKMEDIQGVVKTLSTLLDKGNREDLRAQVSKLLENNDKKSVFTSMADQYIAGTSSYHANSITDDSDTDTAYSYDNYTDTDGSDTEQGRVHTFSDSEDEA